METKPDKTVEQMIAAAVTAVNENGQQREKAMKRMNRKLATQMRCLGLTVALWGTLASTEAAVQLNLDGHRWERASVTYWVNSPGGVSDAALNDVARAIDDWNRALQTIDPAGTIVPRLVLAPNRKRADLLFDLRVRETRNVFGGTFVFFGGFSIQTDGCTLTGARINVVGTLLRENPAEGTPFIRSAMRYYIGRILGLGVIECDGPVPCSSDVMDRTYLNQLFDAGTYHVELGISACDLEGVMVVYNAPACPQIPAAIDFTCN